MWIRRTMTGYVGLPGGWSVETDRAAGQLRSYVSARLTVPGAAHSVTSRPSVGASRGSRLASGGAVVQGAGPVLLSAAASHGVRKDDPVSSRVLRLARTAGHPSEMAGSAALPVAKPSWVTVS